MPRKRKKVAKSTIRKKQAPKKQAQNTSSTTLVRLEKTLTDAPVNLANQLKKESVTLKQKSLKIKTTISKIESQIKKLEKSIVAAQKLNTATSKKRLKAAKKSLNDTKKDLTLSNKLYKETTRLLESTNLKLSKTLALRKALNNFEKDWRNEVREMAEKAKRKAEAKTRAKKPASKKPKKRVAASTHTNAQPTTNQPTLTVIEQSKDTDSFDKVTTELGDILLDENKKASS